jgi:hypothetical protein
MGNVSDGAWSDEERALLTRIAAGETIVIRIPRGRQARHKRLYARCKAAGLLVRIDRRTDWGNPYLPGRDGDRTDVMQKYRAYLMERPDLLARLGELDGKALACWCAPLPCHGDVLAEAAKQTQP